MMNTPTFAEEAVLAGVMAANERFHDVASLLTADKFTSPLRSRLWSALRDRILAGEPADAVTVAELLPADSAAIMDLACNTAGGPSYASYAKIVHGNWQRREAAQIAMRLMEGSRSGSEGAVNEAIGALMALSATATECDYSLRQAMKLAFQVMQEAYEAGGALPGITTGLVQLDDILGGWHNGDLCVVGARPAAGKTALLTNFAEAAAKANKHVGLISAEQPAEQIALRAISLSSRVGAADLRRGRIDDEAWAKINGAIKSAAGWNVRIYDRSAITLDELVSVARKWKHAHGLDWLGIDYAQRISVPGADRITEVATVARGLKNLARDLGIPVVALAQVKAAVDQRNDKRPTAGDLANSDELTREADAILMLYREETYFHDLNEQNKPVRKGVAEILIEKNRHGPTGYVETAFLAETMRFGNLDRG